MIINFIACQEPSSPFTTDYTHRQQGSSQRREGESQSQHLRLKWEEACWFVGYHQI